MNYALITVKIKGCSILFSNVYSKNERYPKHIIPFIINSFKKDGKVVLLENSKKNCRTFLNNFDSCSAVLALAKTDSALDGSIYNVATDEEISIVELAKLCAKKMGIAEPVIEFQGYRESDPQRRLLSTEKIREKTGWKPKVTRKNSADCGRTSADRVRQISEPHGEGTAKRGRLWVGDARSTEIREKKPIREPTGIPLGASENGGKDRRYILSESRPTRRRCKLRKS